MDWPHSGAVMYYSRFMEPQDGAVSVLLSFQQEAFLCMQCIQKVTAVMGSCLRGAEIKNVTVLAMGKCQVLQKN
jgi:hypothetical protein